MAKNKVFTLKEGEYSADLLCYLAMAVYLGLIEPSELTYMQDSGKTNDLIKDTLRLRVINNRKDRR